MAHSLSAKKRVRQNLKRQQLNRWRKRNLRQAIRAFNERLAGGSIDEARDAFHECQRVIDRSVRAGIIHKNQAARRKSRLNARLKAAAEGTG